MRRLWFDTNVTRSFAPRKLAALAQLAGTKAVQLTVHPQVYLEVRRFMRVDKGPVFNPSLFDQFLVQSRIEFREVTATQATMTDWAELLATRYSTDLAWQDAKRRTLGGVTKDAFKVEPAHMPMTTDWLIALEIESDPESFVITHDDGEEWRPLRDAPQRRAFRWNEATDWLQSL
jgi:hypothetical protein